MRDQHEANSRHPAKTECLTKKQQHWQGYFGFTIDKKRSGQVTAILYIHNKETGACFTVPSDSSITQICRAINIFRDGVEFGRTQLVNQIAGLLAEDEAAFWDYIRDCV